MNRKNVFVALLFCFALLLTACGEETSKTAKDDSAAGIKPAYTAEEKAVAEQYLVKFKEYGRLSDAAYNEAQAPAAQDGVTGTVLYGRVYEGVEKHKLLFQNWVVGDGIVVPRGLEDGHDAVGTYLKLREAALTAYLEYLDDETSLEKRRLFNEKANMAEGVMIRAGGQVIYGLREYDVEYGE